MDSNPSPIPGVPLTPPGSVIWVINGFFVWLPLAAPSTEFSGEADVGGGWTAFIGATIFEFGSVLLMLEAVNEKRERPPLTPTHYPL